MNVIVQVADMGPTIAGIIVGRHRAACALFPATSVLLLHLAATILCDPQALSRGSASPVTAR